MAKLTAAGDRGLETGNDEGLRARASPRELDALEIDPGEQIFSEDELVRMYRAMRLARTFETRLASLYRQGKIIGAVYLGTGQEAIATGGAASMHKDDIFSTVSRSLAA